ncbi:amino acid adenylation domain-containing protein [Paenibacillus sp. NPDC058071]|uniref:non-ribosomal peptide synthetase n=1 Tax=Paenibacillus sp. NPDC058071 TaxID=3346326 RepID=UPI0036DD349C
MNSTSFETICHWFQDTAARNPDSCCLEYGDLRISYREVNEQSNQLARFLQRHGAGPETLIGIYQPRSPEMIISILAVLKSGAAYVPLSTALPEERLAYIAQEANFKIILSDSSYEQKIATILYKQDGSSVKLWTMDQIRSEIESLPAGELAVQIAPHDLAYIIYTSGSTGKPKGVMIEHRGIPNLIHEQIGKFRLNSGDRVLQYASASFDASVSEIFTCLVAGATLVLLPDEGLYIGDKLYQVLKDKQISVVTLVPSVLNGLPQEELPDLKTVVTAGEACTRKLIQYWAPKLNFLNAYGPTESTVCATIHECDADDEIISLGAPLQGTAVYLLNEQLEPVGTGKTGELYLSSVGLARGYLNKPELTASRFIKNPFNDGFNERLYRTGDLCLKTDSGDFQWAGRADLQVKVSGIRIELEEIEHALREHAEIEEAVVTYHSEGSYIAAYLKSNTPFKPSIRQVRDYLLTKFPPYMIPTRFLFVDDFAVMNSGKIDRNALPAIEIARRVTETVYAAPTSYMEKELAQIWSEVLKIDQVGLHDNFYELGGQSLMATQIVSRIRSVLGMEIPLQIIFSSEPTIEQTALAIEQYQLEQIDSSELELLLAELDNA